MNLRWGNFIWICKALIWLKRERERDSYYIKTLNPLSLSIFYYYSFLKSLYFVILKYIRCLEDECLFIWKYVNFELFIPLKLLRKLWNFIFNEVYQTSFVTKGVEIRRCLLFNAFNNTPPVFCWQIESFYKLCVISRHCIILWRKKYLSQCLILDFSYWSIKNS